MVTTGRSAAGAAKRPGALRAMQAVVGLMALLILLQAVLAGRRWAGDDTTTVHGMVGNVVFLLALANVALVFVAGLTGRARSVLTGIAVLLVILLTAQIGLGYAGDGQSEAIAWHIPNGVLIFGLAVANTFLVERMTRDVP